MGEAIAPAAVMIPAMLALLIVFGVYIMAELIVNVAQHIGIGGLPVIGGAIMGALKGIAGGLNAAVGWLWQHANPVNVAVATFGWSGAALSNNATTLIAAQYAQAHRLATVAIPNAITLAHAYALYYYNAAVAAIDVRAAATTLFATKLYLDALAAVNAARVAATGYTDAKFNIAMQELNGVKAAVTAATLGLIQSLQGWVTQELTQLRTYVNQTDAARGATTQGEINTAIGDVTATLGIGIAAAAAAAAAAAKAFEDWKNKCGDPLCNNLSGFGNIISQILGIVSDGALIALIAKAVSDPQGTVDFIEADIVGPVDDAVGAIAGLVGFKTAA